MTTNENKKPEATEVKPSDDELTTEDLDKVSGGAAVGDGGDKGRILGKGLSDKGDKGATIGKEITFGTTPVKK